MKMQSQIQQNNSILLPEQIHDREIKGFKRRYPIFPKKQQHIPFNAENLNLQNIPQQQILMKSSDIKSNSIEKVQQKTLDRQQCYFQSQVLIQKQLVNQNKQLSEQYDSEEQLDLVELPLNSKEQFFPNNRQIKTKKSFLQDQQQFIEKNEVKSQIFDEQAFFTKYSSLSEIKKTNSQIQISNLSIQQQVQELESQIYFQNNERNEVSMKIYEINNFINQFQKQYKHCLNYISKIENQIEDIESSRHLGKKNFQTEDTDKNQHQANQSDEEEEEDQIEELLEGKIIDLQKIKYQHFEESQEDQFTESHIVPSYILSEFIAQKQVESQLKRIEKQKERIQKQKEGKDKEETLLLIQKEQQLSSTFNPLFNLTVKQQHQLKKFISEEIQNANENTIKFNLIYRRCKDIVSSCNVGSREDLEYKQNILMVCCNQNNKIFGGYMQNNYIEHQIIEDQHAFIFTKTTFNQQHIQSQNKNVLEKYKILKESFSSAISISNHYLICFGNDLMISSCCLDEESYCQWPSSYEASPNDKNNNNQWFAGNYQFVMTALQVYEVVFE